MLKINARIGIKVVFGRPGQLAEKSVGEIIKLNPTKAKVKLLEERGTHRTYPVGTIFAVPYSLMEEQPHDGSKNVQNKGNTDIYPGLHFHAPYADSNSRWKVVSKKAKDCWLCEIDNEPFQLPDGQILEGEWNGTQRAFLVHEILHSKNLKEVFSQLHDLNENFYANLKIGQIVHYQNGFNQWIRCESIKTDEGKALLPLALLGDWQAFDLPYRTKDGTVKLSYHVKQIFERKAFHPNASCIWEGNYYRRDNEVNPTTLSPISLEIPPMNAEQEQKAKLWQTIDQIRNLVNQSNDDPQILLNQISCLIGDKNQ